MASCWSWRTRSILISMAYFEELKRSMDWLSAKHDTVFIGQAVSVPGTAMSNTLRDVSEDKKLELPVFEDTQMGMSLGMSLAGYRVVSIFPRWNFLLCATNQLVSHVDKYPTITSGRVNPGLIIRTGVGSERPLFPGHQHVGNMSEAFRLMLSTVDIIELEEPHDIYPAYQHAYHRTDGKSTLLVEYGDYYSEK